MLLGHVIEVTPSGAFRFALKALLFSKVEKIRPVALKVSL
jgi:hypothetical protein